MKLLKEARVIQTCVQFDDKTTDQSGKLKKKKKQSLKKLLGSANFNLKIYKSLRHHRHNQKFSSMCNKIITIYISILKSVDCIYSSMAWGGQHCEMGKTMDSESANPVPPISKQ